MNSLPAWANLLGSLLMAFLCVGALELLAWINGDSVPTWAVYLASLSGVILWTRPSYDRQQDFERRHHDIS